MTAKAKSDAIWTISSTVSHGSKVKGEESDVVKSERPQQHLMEPADDGTSQVMADEAAVEGSCLVLQLTSFHWIIPPPTPPLRVMWWLQL